ncbi:MAG TPA: PAS domain-containing protein, partial [Opitutaceae bacterium]
MSAPQREDRVTGPAPQSSPLPAATAAGTNGSLPPIGELKPLTLPEGFVAPEVAALFSQWMRSSADLVYFKDRQSRFVEVSASKATLHGTTPQDFFGRTDFDFFPEATAKAAIQDEQLIMVTGRGVIDRLETETWSDGNTRSYLVSKLPLRDASGQVTGLCCIQKDVTQSVATQRALETTNQQLVEATRQAGMAEVATGVLHNVGN